MKTIPSIYFGPFGGPTNVGAFRVLSVNEGGRVSFSVTRKSFHVWVCGWAFGFDRDGFYSGGYPLNWLVRRLWCQHDWWPIGFADWRCQKCGKDR